MTLEEGKSEALRAALACIGEATALDGGPRYPERVVHKLSQAVVCRNYARPILELVHLLIAASARDGRFEDVFWGLDRVGASGFRRVFEDLQAACPSIELTTDGVATGDDGFVVTYGRMPFLAALLEFLITVFGYQEFDDLTKPLRDGVANKATVQETALGLQRRLYAYLKDHLPTAQRQRRERQFLSYIDEHAGNRIGVEAIDDRVVLDYWCAFATDPERTARTYRAVYDTAVRLIAALDAAETRLAGRRARSIGTDFEAGDVDPADIDAVAEAIDEGDGPLQRLSDAADGRIKFVNVREAEILGELPLGTVMSGAGRRVPVSVLRNAVFGGHQLRITSAVRKGEPVADLLGGPMGPVYRDRLAAFGDVADTVERLAMAALSILHAAGRAEAIELALALAPDLDWGHLAGAEGGTSDNVVPMAVHAASAQFFAARPDPKGDELPALLTEARRALRQVNRAGFKREADTATLDAFAASVPCVLQLIAEVRRFVEREARDLPWQELEARDGEVFSGMYRTLYDAGESEVRDAGE